jgi:hypothetical protein
LHVAILKFHSVFFVLLIPLQLIYITNSMEFVLAVYNCNRTTTNGIFCTVYFRHDVSGDVYSGFKVIS